MCSTLRSLSNKWFITIAFLALTITGGQAMEKDSVWIKQFNHYVYRKAKSATADTTAYYNWKGFHLARKHQNDSLQLVCMENMLNIPILDSIQRYIAVVDTFPTTFFQFTVKNQLELSYYRYKANKLQNEDLQGFLRELIHKVDSTYADSIFTNGTKQDTLKYLLNNRLYLATLFNTVSVQTKDSPFYPYLNRYNEILEVIPDKYANAKVNSLVGSSALYLTMGDYDKVLRYSEQVIQYILKTYNYPATYDKMDITYASILYYMCYQQLQCYDLISPEILARNWAYMTSARADESREYLKTFDGHYFWTEMFYAMCVKDYNKAIESSDQNMTKMNGHIAEQTICAAVQNVAIKRVKNRRKYIMNLRRNYELTKRFNMEHTEEKHKDFATLYHVNQLEQTISGNLLLEAQRKVTRFWWLLGGGLVVLGLLLGGMYSTFSASKKNRKVMKKVQEELDTTKQKTLEAEKARKIQSLYLNNMNHEVRSPLNAIVGFSKLLLEEDDLDEETKQTYSKYIKTSSDLLLQIVNDVLDSAQLKSGNYALNKRNCRVAGVCEQAIESMQDRVLDDVQLVLDCKIDKDTLAITDKNRLLQILLNYLSNACKHTTKGVIILACQWLDEAQTSLRFTVTDTGTGVPAEKQDQLFQRFEKFNDSVEGTGLGLNICATLAELLEGQVGYDKEYHNGARFYFNLPVHS